MNAGTESFSNQSGDSLTYTLIGDPTESPALVCHPGGPGMSGSYFGDLAGLAPDGVCVVQLHPRGTGGSAEPSDGSYELDEYAADVDALRRHLGLEQIDYLGHSHGGFVGILYASSYPEALDRLVLLCTAPRFSDELAAEAGAALELHAGEDWYEDALAARRQRAAWQFETREELAALYARESRLWFTTAAGYAQIGASIRANLPQPEALRYFNTRLAPSFDLRDRLDRIEAPTLILNGEEDFFGPRISARELSAIPGSVAKILPGAGHFPFADTPEAFRAELEAFLAR